MPSFVLRRQVMLGVGACGGLALAMPHVARAAARVVRFGHNNTDPSHFGMGAVAFAAAVAADPVLSGVLRIEVHGNAELGDELNMLKSCAAGTLDCAIISNAVIGNVVPEAGVLDAPFLFRDVAHARAALDGKIGEEFTAFAAAKNVKVLAWSENGLRHITSNIPIRKPADLRGLKIRVPQSDVMVGGFKALGADPHPLNFNLLREALRSGEFQAQENPIVVIEANKFYELQKYLSLTGHIYDPAAYMCSADLAEDLTAAQLSALAACARKASEVTRQVSGSAQSDGIARMRAAGMTVIGDVEVDAFRATTRPYLESLSANYGADLMGRLLVAGA
jgi:tripartite ATP-independent transporter DctP family solute receptor